jgi:pimeloyl-ACP methyl ester carboxylesterase
VSGSGALWEIDKPARWNGDLVVYLHGYSNPADRIALPNNGPIRDSLVAMGFAVAASSFASNGYAVREGVQDSRRLSEIFATRFGRPQHTYLLGQSLGGLIGMILSQRHPQDYDGSLLVCGIVGGSDDEIQYVGDIRVLFDAVYPGVLPGGLEHPPVVTDINAQVIRPVVAAIQQNPQGVGIVQSLARHPLAGASSQEVVNSLVTVLGFSMQGGADLFERTHRQSYFDNAGWRYASPALPASIVEDVNARVARYTATPEANAFLARFGEPQGAFRIPVIALHTSRDPVVPVFHEDLLAQVGAGPMLLQHRVERYGHCTFSVGELMSEFSELVAWASSRHKRAA